jgi:hypothetical protein
MFLKIITPLFLTTFLIYSCKNELPSTEKPDLKDTITSQKTDTVRQVVENSPKKVEIVSEKVEKVENHAKIVEQFGEQWDFCNCVIKNDSINKAFEKNLSDKQSEKLMARWEFVENKCKEFLTTPNTTPEERLEHELKVKKCLKNAKR